MEELLNRLHERDQAVKPELISVINDYNRLTAICRSFSSQRSILERSLSRMLRGGAGTPRKDDDSAQSMQNNATSQALLTLHGQLVASKEKAASSEARITSLTQQLSQANGEIFEMKTRISELEGELRLMRSNFVASQAEADRVRMELDSVREIHEQAIDQLQEAKLTHAQMTETVGPVQGVTGPAPSGGRIEAVQESPHPLMLPRSIQHTLKGHTGAVLACSVTSDGLVVATGGDDRAVRTFDSLNGSRIGTAGDSVAGITSVDFATDRVVISGYSSGAVRCTDTTGKIRHSMSGHSGSILDVSRINSECAASSSQDRTIKLWSLQKGSLITSLPTGSPVTCIAPTADGRLMWTSHLNRTVQLWDSRSQSVCMELPKTHTQLISSLSLFRDGARLLTNGLDSMLCVFDTRALGATLRMKNPAFVSTARYSRATLCGGRAALVGTKGGGICVFNLQSGNLETVVKGHDADVLCIASNSGTVVSSLEDASQTMLLHGEPISDATYTSLLHDTQLLAELMDDLESDAVSDEAVARVLGDLDVPVVIYGDEDDEEDYEDEYDRYY
ncbi:WD domain, G-beta repeat [Carpediemonas membranifera]|uniref:WD domain, G-beta repeat n=1 Tax=Carpediemonas membranifera TaxID=201153 RepID=A0A8J6B6E2_9EUKA|nr:WD domain, G-beta repeat [Carpediemonas membranifera]|eukprot:KAG9394034.1 WD domain, G-beta repeat [Carpediemonas membranifera]